ncbi:MAG: TolC family protein [Flavipsychrobacter sp.]|nr:TolC family protein [Flavipsychrobacter sp.]
MRRTLVSILALAACGTQAWAQEPMQLSLSNAMEYAVKNNAAAKNARIDVAIQEAQNKQTTAIALPQLNAKGDFTGFFNVQKAFVPGEFIGQPGTFVPVAFTPRYSTTASATATQVLFDGSVLVALQARQAVMELAMKKGRLTEEMIRYEVQKAYYGIVIAHRQVSILNRSLASLRSIADDLRQLKEAGFVEKIELDRTNVQVNNLATDSLKAHSFLEVSEQGLKYAMGLDINTPIVLTDTSVEGAIDKGVQLASSAANYNSRTEYALLQNLQQLNNYNLKRYKLAALPSLAAVGSLGYNFGTNSFNQVFDFRKYYQFFSFAGLQLNVPLFSGFKRTNQVREAKLNIERTNNDIEQQKLSIDFEVESSKTTFKNALIQLKSQEQNLQLAQTVLELAQKKYKAGVGSNIEVNQAQTELLRAQNNYFTTLLESITAQSDLQKALGNFK